MRILVILCALALSACNLAGDKPEVTACETMARETLDLPQYYQRRDASSANEPLTNAEMEEIRAAVPAVMQGRPGILTAVVEYEARTSDGLTYNGAQICQFYTRDGEPIGGTVGMTATARAYVSEVIAGVRPRTAVVLPF